VKVKVKVKAKVSKAALPVTWQRAREM